MRTPRELITETLLSRTVSIIVAIALPCIAFLYGAKYQKLLNTLHTANAYAEALSQAQKELNNQK